jgi:hypothetical protein
LEIDELVGGVSLLWSAAHSDGRLLKDSDLLKSDVIRPMAAALSSDWDNVQAACVKGTEMIRELGYEYGSRGHFSSSYALSIVWGWAYLAERWRSANLVREAEKDDFEKRCRFAMRGCLDRWLLGSQWAEVWAKSSRTTIEGYLQKLHDTSRKMEGLTDAIQAHEVWAEYLPGLVKSFESAAVDYVNTCDVQNPDGVRSYRNLLWIWHRLDPKRWEVSKVQLRVTGARKDPDHDVDHVMSHKVWKNLAQAEDDAPIANRLGNCALLEKNFNISKSARSARSFLEQIHEFKQGQLTVDDWAVALSVPAALLDPASSSISALRLAVEDRDKTMKEELVSFVRGQRRRTDQ